MTDHSSEAEPLRLIRDAVDGQVARLLAAAVILVAAGSLLSAVTPLLLARIVDGGAQALQSGSPVPNAAMVVLLTGYALAIGLVRLLAEWRALLAARAEQRLLARLTEGAFARLISLPMPFHLARRPGELVQAVQLAGTGCQLITGHLVGSALPVLIELLAVTVVLASVVTAGLMATFLVSCTLLLALHASVAFRLTRRAHAIAAASLDAGALQADALEHCEVLKCFCAERRIRERLGDLLSTLQSQWNRLQLDRAQAGTLAAVIVAGAMGLCLAQAAAAVGQGRLSVGGVVLVNVYLLQVLRPLEVLGAAVRDITQAVGWIRPLVGLLHTPPEETHGGVEATPSPSALTSRGRRAPSIHFDSVCFGYRPGHPVLENLSFDVPPGRTLAIVGASGCGKSTVARLLLRLHSHQGGIIRLGPTCINGIGLSELRNQIGVAAQDTALLDGTLAFNIGMGRSGASAGEIADAARRAGLAGTVGSLPAGLDTRVGPRGQMLSGGERQRVAIARVLLKDPDVLVLDEATSMLDAETEAAVMAELMSPSRGRTIVLIAHRLNIVPRADEIVFLEGGRVAERGSHASLLAQNGAYARLWSRQQRAAADP